ncbi:MAG: 2-oxo acid dehydrogenase subunit E2 [Deltaproteobacteria bacterium]|nr:2-oxo acid dehydrogenase subunit E2 [Deltaproteobacteria bacterium]
MVYERGLTTNVLLSKANTAETNNFLAVKGATHILRTFARFFLHAPVVEPKWIDGQWVAKPIVRVTMVLDHRLIDGSHVNAFTRTVNEIVADAPNRL